MSELKIFENAQFGNVRVIEKDGQPWFVARDVAIALGYADPADAIQRHCKKVNDSNMGISPSVPSPKIIPESDVYRLIMRSNLPTAEEFQEWVFGEVLPSIRKHGMYATDNIIEQILNNPQFGIDLLTKLKEERQGRIEAEKTVNILTHVNKTYTSTEVAKECGMKSAVQLNKFLHDRGVQFQQNGTWVPYSRFSQLGWFEIKQEVLDTGRIIYHRRITGIGREAVLKMITTS